MKSVLMSIQPKWCELIASGKKTVEIRKTKPKFETPFKVYIYCTKGDPLMKTADNTCFIDNTYIEGQNLYGLYELINGKVIGEFVCNRLVFLDAYYDTNGNRHLCNTAFIKNPCLTDDELFDYLYGKHGRKHGGWAWHISDLAIYDEPKEIDDFFHACDKPIGTDCAVCLDRRENKCKSIKRPPQSWCYVEGGE